MSIWQFVKRVTASATSGVTGVVEAVRTIFGGNPELRRRVAFSVAMIALSAKMAKADGIVTHDEVRAFQQIFEVPVSERHNVARLYDLAKQDVAGFEIYAERMAGLCGSGHQTAPCWKTYSTASSTSPRPTVCCTSAGRFLHRVTQIFRIEGEPLPEHPRAPRPSRRRRSLADPRRRARDTLRRGQALQARRRKPSRQALARGLPEEFIKIATTRIAAINAAYEMIERGLKVI